MRRKWARQELNLRPLGYEPTALTAELRALRITPNMLAKLSDTLIKTKDFDIFGVSWLT